jgi:hypothetical protein
VSGRDPLADAVRALKPAPPAERLDPETLIAFARGELEPAEREGVAEHLTGSPEDAEMLLAWSEFAEEAPVKPTPAEQDAAWQRFADRLAAEPLVRPAAVLGSFPAAAPAPPVTTSRWMPVALAASLLRATISVTWALWERGRSARNLGIHGNPAIVGLAADGAGPGDRSSSPETVRLSQGQIEAILVLTPPGDLAAARRFEGRLISPSGRELWRETLVPTERGTFTVHLEPPRLALGRYTIAVDEWRGSAVLPVARFSFEIVARDPAGSSSNR